MKLKYIFGVVVSALILMGCSEDQTLGSLGSISLDKTYVSIPEGGGDVTVRITASQDWQMAKVFTVREKDADGNNINVDYPLPTWLTASQVAGNAGTTELTLHADATSGGREAELQIVVGDHKQFLMVRQGSMEASSATCAEVIAGPDGKTYRIKGVCTSIANTTYGNWYLDDGTGTVYIYGTLDKDGATKNFLSLGIEVGDIVEVEGPKTTYNGTVELVDVTVLSIEKSLIKVISEGAKIAKEGGPLEVKVAYKGSGAYCSIPDEFKDWISYEDTQFVPGVATIFETNPADTAIMKFNIAENAGGSREATINFKSANQSSESNATYSFKQEGISNPPVGKGTLDDPYNVPAAIAACEAGATEVYVTGVVCTAPTTINTKYGSATYYISVDGNETDRLQIYSGKYIANTDFTSTDQIKVGDVVVVYGNLKMYNGNPEMDMNNYIYSLNGKTTEGVSEKGMGVDNPFTVAEVIAYTKALGVDVKSSVDVYVKGKISSVKHFYSQEYGTCNYNISDDGTETNQFTVYGSYYFGNKPWTEGGYQIAVGDEVIVCGKVIDYKGTTPEFANKENWLVSINGKTN
ncbi:MAG: BACON domain-containing protein [Prevotella sp.]|nr:BACON domain-containing protein [Prevotella sp.]